MYKVQIKRNYREFHGIGEGIYKIIFKSVIECETCKYHSINLFYHYFGHLVYLNLVVEGRGNSCKASVAVGTKLN
jgi:hypothetical protein